MRVLIFAAALALPAPAIASEPIYDCGWISDDVNEQHGKVLAVSLGAEKVAENLWALEPEKAEALREATDEMQAAFAAYVRALHALCPPSD